MTNKLIGRVVTGKGEGASLTQLDWARQQFVAKLGIDPFPGTLNLILDTPDALAVWAEWQTTRGIVIDPPNAEWCSARCYFVRIANQINGAIVLPEVNGYAPSQIEIIANVSLRETLQLKDGDAVTLQIELTHSIAPLHYTN